MPDNSGEYVIVVGCGRVGAELATTLSAEGQSVVVIDREMDAFERLGEAFTGATIFGNAMDEEVLVSAGMNHADAVVTATQGDNTNIMIGQMAKTLFGVKRVVVRCYDPVRSDTYAALGLKTVCPTRIGAQIMRDSLLESADKCS